MTFTTLLKHGVLSMAVVQLLAVSVHGQPTLKPLADPSEPAGLTPKKQRPLAHICTGKQGNNYHEHGEKIKTRLATTVDVVNISTRGSWENIERIDKTPRQCDAIIAQEDAYLLHQFEKPDSNLTMNRMATLYPEYVHLLCNRQVKGRYLHDVDPKKYPIITNEYGSGSYITWRLFRRLNPQYKKFQVVEKSVDEAMLSVVDDSRPACFFFVSGLGGRTLQTADQTFGDALRLVGIDDPKLYRPLGREKRRVYRGAVIPDGWYRTLGGGGLKTPVVDAVFFVSPEWKARYPKGAAGMAELMLKMMIEQRRKKPTQTVSPAAAPAPND
ncbi:MAG: TAXI family TRAP transporter solute-binding subunit [Myxococcota bacterium]|nr:TAXI family TRAP transporter solute-binding subunit [Myxococcota bacterium]